MRGHCSFTSFLFLCALCVSAVQFVYAEDWPQWRGPRGDGTSVDAAPPTKWSTGENVKWKAAIPGKGHGSPAIAGGKVFLNTCIEKENRRVLLCLDRADGQVENSAVVRQARLRDRLAEVAFTVAA